MKAQKVVLFVGVLLLIVWFLCTQKRAVRRVRRVRPLTEEIGDEKDLHIDGVTENDDQYIVVHDRYAN